jgi:hypothetical protein
MLVIAPPTETNPGGAKGDTMPYMAAAELQGVDAVFTAPTSNLYGKVADFHLQFHGGLTGFRLVGFSVHQKPNAGALFISYPCGTSRSISLFRGEQERMESFERAVLAAYRDWLDGIDGRPEFEPLVGVDGM